VKKRNHRHCQFPLFILFFVASISCNLSYPQGYGAINGKVIDKRTNVPVPHVNIYLSQTTIGTPSELDGSYTIYNIPAGSYKLIFNHVGYQLKLISVQIPANQLTEINVKLEEYVFSGEEMIVFDSLPKNWSKNLEEFQKIFIGSTPNSPYCKIINPEVLNFSYLSSNNFLCASSDSVILIENMALGYSIRVRLVSFEKKLKPSIQFS